MSWKGKINEALRTFGPAFLVSVAYLDPGNWATAIEGGSRFGYQLIWVVVVSNLIAILLQVLAARLGIVSGKHLAEVCREQYPQWICFLLWCLSEISIVALDLTMVLGTAVGINLLFGISLLPCIFLTSLDFVVILFTVPKVGRVRIFEICTVCIVGVVVACFVVDVALSAPPLRLVLHGFIPNLNRDSIYTAVSLLGANVMPHNFYLHSALVKGRHNGSYSTQELCRLNLIDVALALGVALFINVAVLAVSASTFHSAGVVVETLQSAHDFMELLLSSQIAPAVFGLALILTSQLSTFTGTLSGQGFLNKEVSPWLHRLLTRLLAIVPAACLQHVYGDRGTYKMLVIAQVVLAIQLPFTLVPLIKATSHQSIMGPFANGVIIQVLSWLSTVLIFMVNLMLFAATVLPSEKTGLLVLLHSPWILLKMPWRTSLLALIAVLGIVAALSLLLWMLFRPITSKEAVTDRSVDVYICTSDHATREIVEVSPEAHLQEIVLDAATGDVHCCIVNSPERGLGRGARKAFAAALDTFWASFFDLHGRSVGSGLPSGLPAQLNQCLLTIHQLDNAGAVFHSSAGPPWDVVDKEVLSLLHVAMLGDRETSFPRQCPNCSTTINDPAGLDVRCTAGSGVRWNFLVLMGVWSLRTVLRLTAAEPRPELWGRYATVLNRLQWLLPHLPVEINGNEIVSNDVLRLIDNVEQQAMVKKGPKGTLPAATAYPKGKEILISIVRRYKRVLKRSTIGTGIGAGTSIIGILHFLFSLYTNADNA